MEQNPYTPPAAESDIETETHSIWIKIGAMVSLCLFTGVIQGLIGTILGMISAFSTLTHTTRQFLTANGR